MMTAGAVAFILTLLLFIYLSVYELYRGIFCYPVKKRKNIRQIPNSNLYRAHKDKMMQVIDDMAKTPCEEVGIRSADGIGLFGRLYLMGEYAGKDEESSQKSNVPLIIFFHGYHGTYAWDGYGFFKLCKKNGINLLMVDERAHGKSEGKNITFGIKERYDCKSWAEYAAKRFGEDTDIFLAGVSMGAASVMMSSELGLPKSVRGLIADCGYSEPAAIIKETVKTMKLPVQPFYQLIKLSARLFGRINLEEASALQAVRELKIPILFIHGAQDSVVPPSMGEELYKVCKAEKERLLVSGADHANSAMTDYEMYEKAVWRFIAKSYIST